MLKANIFKSLDALVDLKIAGKPIGVAFSGGGDSIALLSLTLKWLAGRQNLHALIVDHGLRAGSSKEVQMAAQVAKNLGAIPHILTWQGAKPTASLQEKARMARYSLMGAKCRSLGIETLLLGHNQNDQAETVYMRGQKNSGWRGMAGMRANVRAPIWPELYGVNIVRPMLGVSREMLRSYDRENDLDFIDDPSNENQMFTRVQARTYLKTRPSLAAMLHTIAQDAGRGLREERMQLRALLAAHVKIHHWGGVTLNKQAIAGNGDLGCELLRCLSLAVSGQGQAPAREKFSKLRGSILSPRFQGATLGGAQFIANETDVQLVRDPGQVLGRSGRGGLDLQPLCAGEDFVWDGRFHVQVAEEGLSVAPLAAYADMLTKRQKQVLKSIPLSARMTLPALVRAGTLVYSPVDEPSTRYQLNSLTRQRLANLSD